jgi:membrane protease YdiL (CAAX protease family)
MGAQSSTDWSQRGQQLTEVLLVVFGAVLFAAALMGSLKPVIVDAGPVAAGSNGAAIVGFLLQYAGFAVVVGWYLQVVTDWQLVGWDRPDRRDLGLMAVGIVVLVGANRAITRLFSWGDVDVGTNTAVTAGAGDPGYLLAMVVVSLCVVGPVEELLFRGVVQGRLRESWGVWPAILAATVLFGLSHVSVSGGAAGIAAYILTATVLGVLLGYLYERTGTIVVPAVIHGVNNAVIFAGLYLGEIGVL